MTMFERTMIDVDERVARVVTRPRGGGRAYEYRLHRKGGAWVLSRELDWYTEHALRYAEKELDEQVMRRRVDGEQMTFADYGENADDCPSDRRQGVPAARAD